MVLQVLPPLCRTERAAVCRSGPERCGPGAGGEGLPGPGPAAHPPQGADDGDPGVSAADGRGLVSEGRLWGGAHPSSPAHPESGVRKD
jgi:hypothetical protein